MSRIGIGDLLSYVDLRKTYLAPDGYRRYFGSCPICGEGRDRFYITDFGAYTMFWCRQGHHQPAHLHNPRGLPFGHKAYWFGEISTDSYR